MKERLKIILTGLGIIIVAIIGLWEYMQMFLYFDLPQVIVVLPVVGALAAILLRKFSFLALGATAVVSILFQLVEEGRESKIAIILNILPIIIIFMLIGIGGGFLVRVLIDGKKSKAVGIICCVLGVIVTFGGGVAVFGNPLYPFTARYAIHKYAEKYDTEQYRVSEVSVYYSIQDMQYQGRVEMSDGVIYIIYYDRATGECQEN